MSRAERTPRAASVQVNFLEKAGCSDVQQVPCRAALSEFERLRPEANS
jgi:hypothetical protein